jgi:hypothetical protein
MAVEEVDLTGDVPVSIPGRKRKANDISKEPSSAFASSSGTRTQASQTIDLTGSDDNENVMSECLEKPKRKRKTKKSEDDEPSEKPKQTKRGKKKGGDGDDGEKRLRQYVSPDF